jgi:hypothetical protein
MSKAIKLLEKIAKTEEETGGKKTNPFLIAGIPLAALGALSLPGSIPASKMALKQLMDPRMNVKRNPETEAIIEGTEGFLARHFGRKYMPAEFVADYIESGHGLGNTPYKEGFKAFAKSQAKTTPTYPTLEAAKREAIDHYDKFTGPEREGLLKWLDEMRAHNLENMTYAKEPGAKGKHIMHDGKYVEKMPGKDHRTSKKMQEFERRAEKFKALVEQEGDVLANIRNTKDEDILHILKTMQAQKAGVGAMYGKAGLAGLGMTAAGAGLTGVGAAKHIYDNKKEKSHS